VLVLDADEIVTCFDSESIENMIQQDQDIVGRIELSNILANAMGDKRYIERLSRLFNRKSFHYEGIIHEQVVRLDGLPYTTTPVAISADHIGYTQQVIVRTNKIIRNISLLEQALHKSPKDDYLLYQLGKSYFMAEKFQEAVGYFKKALEVPPNFALEYVEDLVETYGYALMNSEAYSEAMSLDHYAKYYDHSTDFLFLLGLVYMNNGMFSRGAEYFLRCLGNKAGKIAGINSYLPAYNAAVIHECLGQVTEAIYYYEKCGDYPVALERLKMLNR
jgi:tetratricopeptide (TPR) repeat protein